MSRAEDQPIVCECCGLKHYKRICESCGKPFNAYRSDQTHCRECNRACYWKDYYKKNKDEIKRRRLRRLQINRPNEGESISKANQYSIARMLAEAGGRRQ